MRIRTRISSTWLSAVPTFAGVAAGWLGCGQLGEPPVAADSVYISPGGVGQPGGPASSAGGNLPASGNGSVPGSPNATSGASGSGAGAQPGTPGYVPSPGNMLMAGTKPSFACNANANKPEDTLRRLTMTQLRNSLYDLVNWSTSGDANTLKALAQFTDQLPADQRQPVVQDVHGSFRRLDQSLQQDHVDSLYAAGSGIAGLLTSSTVLNKVAGACATDKDAANDAACVSDFIKRFGQRAFRRPLAAEEVTFYQGVYGTKLSPDPAAFSDVIAAMLSAPDVVYFVEHGSDAIDATKGVYKLTPSELASRLSYQLWQTAPDDQLLAAALDGSLTKDDGYEKQVDRLLADARAKTTLREFVTDWLKVEDLPALDKNLNDPVFAAFAGTMKPDAELRTQMINEALDFVDYFTWTDPGSVSRLLTSNYGFPRGGSLAKVYGTSTWDGKAEPIKLDEARAGLFTRAVFLSTGSANTRPIMKGVFLRKQVLCDTIPSPPAGANSNLPDLPATLTTREVVEQLTEVPGSVCSGCHTLAINGLGFATENFDSLGRLRAEQIMYDTKGKEIARKAVKTASVPRVVGGDTGEVTGAAGLMKQIADSGKFEACVARNYFRFTYARWEDADGDGCALEGMRTNLIKGSSFATIAKSIVTDASFKQRKFK